MMWNALLLTVVSWFVSILVQIQMAVVFVALGQLVVGLAFVPDRVGGDFLARAFDPITWRRNEVVRKFLTKLIWKAHKSTLADESLHL